MGKLRKGELERNSEGAEDETNAQQGVRFELRLQTGRLLLGVCKR